MFKNGKIHYRYKLHPIRNTTHDVIRSIEITMVNVHYSQIDLRKRESKLSGLGVVGLVKIII